MPLTKYARFDATEILEIKGSRDKREDASLSRVASFDQYRTDQGYMYVRLRAISSRVNQNWDGWPTVELAGDSSILSHHQSSEGFTVEASAGNPNFGFPTFLGKPIFVDHNNGNPKRTRGVIVDSKFRVIGPKEASLDPYWSSKDVDPAHLPAAEIELLLEIDAKSFPKLAQAILSGDLDGFSMGADVERSKCSHCGNVASSPEEYCSHVLMKGAYHDVKTASGERIAKRSYENCFPAGTFVLMADGSDKAIEDIVEGDRVIDHLGQSQTVEKTFINDVDEDLYEIHRIGQGTQNPLTATGNHPVLAITWPEWVEKRKKSEMVRLLDEGMVSPEFVPANQVRPGDFVAEVTPEHRPVMDHISIEQYLSKSEYDTTFCSSQCYGAFRTGNMYHRPNPRDLPATIDLNEDFGRWVGWYLAEGNVAYNRSRVSGRRLPSMVQFSLHIDEQDYADEIARLGEKLFGVTAHHDTRVGVNSRTVCFYSSNLANFMLSFGDSAYTKCLPDELLQAPIQFINGVVSAHHNGDGHHDPDGARPYEYQHVISSHVLGRQLYKMHLYLGHTVNRHHDMPTEQNKRTVPATVVKHATGGRNRGRFDYDAWRFAEVTNITRSPHNGPVYNLGVSNSHTYVANGQAVHNCEGIHFFEISAVFNPADPTALRREVKAGVEKESMEADGFAKEAVHPINDQLYNEIEQRTPGDLTDGASFVQDDQETPTLGPTLRGEIDPATDHEGFIPLNWTHDPRKLPQNLGPVHQGSVKTAENPLPQSMLVHAPETVDTLRDEHICPICGSVMQGETCDVCFPPGTLVRTKKGYRPIETIVVGDEVLGADGQFRRVADVMVREYEGILKKIDAPSLVEPILATPNHPFSVLVSNTGPHDCGPHRCGRGSSFETNHRLDWVHAGCLSDQNYVTANVPRQTDDISSVDVPSRYTDPRKHGSKRKGPHSFSLTNEFLWAIGLYIAEGSSGDRSITYSLHNDEQEYQVRVQNLFEGYGYTTRLEHRQNKPNSAWVHVNSSVLSEWFPDWLGRGCANKQIPAELMDLPNEKLEALYRGYLDGDGSTRGNSAKTTSSILALQISEIAQRLGSRASIQTERPVNKRTAYTVNNVTSSRRDYHIVKTDAPEKDRRTRNTWEWDDHVLYRLTSVEDVEYSGPVYNLTVEGNPTYTVQNLLVHNCGYVEPPKGFDNPDLSQAEKIRGEMKELEKSEADGKSQDQSQAQPAAGKQGGPLSSQMATKASGTNQVTDRMSWQPFVSEKTAARINKVETPVYPSQTVVSNEPTSQVVTSDQTRPVTAAMLTAKRLMATAQRNHTGESMSTRVADATSPGDTAPTTRVDVTGVGGFDQASNDAASKADAQVDVTGIGSTGTQNVDAGKTESLPTASPSSNDSGFNTDKTTEDSGPTATFGDSDGSASGVGEPVTHEAFPASEDGVKKAARVLAAAEAAYVAAKIAYDEKSLEQNEQQGNKPASGGSANKGTQPVDSVGKAQDRVDVLQSTTTPANNSGATSTWTGTDGNGVTKQVDPVDNHKQEWGGVPVPDVKLHTGGVRISTIRLADLEVELGISHRDDYYNRLAHIETLPEASIQAQIESYSKVKTAGLAKAAQMRTAGVTKVPRLFGQQTSAPNGFERIASDHVAKEQSPVTDASLDSGLFL